MTTSEISESSRLLFWAKHASFFLCMIIVPQVLLSLNLGIQSALAVVFMVLSIIGFVLVLMFGLLLIGSPGVEGGGDPKQRRAQFDYLLIGIELSLPYLGVTVGL